MNLDLVLKIHTSEYTFEFIYEFRISIYQFIYMHSYPCILKNSFKFSTFIYEFV